MIEVERPTRSDTPSTIVDDPGDGDVPQKINNKNDRLNKKWIVIVLAAVVAFLLLIVVCPVVVIQKKNHRSSSPDSESSASTNNGNTRAAPTSGPATTTTTVTYEPGRLSSKVNSKLGVRLSVGLDIKRIAVAGESVPGSKSPFELFHRQPDGAATFRVPTNSPYHDIIPGGWVYISNSEDEAPNGGVGAIYFDAQGEVFDYRRLLKGTDRNCSGGKTPWSTWISCEEPWDQRSGRIFELDPFDDSATARVVTPLVDGGGRYEAFAYDIRDKSRPRFFYSEDFKSGPIRRFTPKTVNWDNPKDMLHGDGTIHYLVLEPDFEGANYGAIDWTTNREVGEGCAQKFFPMTEGIDCFEGRLHFVNNWWSLLYSVDLDSGTFESTSTIGGAFGGTPDQMARIVGDDAESPVLYFTEDGESCGAAAGVHARDQNNFFSILESDDWSESSGLAFSPDGLFMYVSHQTRGELFVVWRQDGLPFHGRIANIHHHTVTGEHAPGWEGDQPDYWTWSTD